MAEAVYVLCALTSLACAVLLLRGYFRSRARLLLWSSICFVTLATNNIILFIDKVLYGPELDLSLWRSSVAVVGIAIMLFGLIWDAE